MINKFNIKNYSQKDLIRLAKRDSNNKRPYLYVNPLQGKHMPVRPIEALELFYNLAVKVQERYADKSVLTIGFAETATAIGAAVGMFCDCVKYSMQTTREDVDGAEYLFFTESHSHATNQKLVINNLDEILNKVDKIVFVEDEVTTGNTICKLIDRMKEKFYDKNLSFGVASLLNSMDNSRVNELARIGIDIIYLCKIENEYNVSSLEKCKYSLEHLINEIYTDRQTDVYSISNKCDLRIVNNKDSYIEACNQFADQIISVINDISEYKKILVIGTEEFMFPPLLVAYKLYILNSNAEILFQASTRSPILSM